MNSIPSDCDTSSLHAFNSSTSIYQHVADICFLKFHRSRLASCLVAGMAYRLSLPQNNVQNQLTLYVVHESLTEDAPCSLTQGPKSSCEQQS